MLTFIVNPQQVVAPQVQGKSEQPFAEGVDNEIQWSDATGVSYGSVKTPAKNTIHIGWLNIGNDQNQNWVKVGGIVLKGRTFDPTNLIEFSPTTEWGKLMSAFLTTNGFVGAYMAMPKSELAV